MAAVAIAHAPKRHLLAGNLPEFRRDRLGFLTACAREHGDLVPLRFGVFRALFINDPHAIEQVLVNTGTFVKSFAYRMVRPVLSSGLLLSEGELWKRQRRLVQPAFNRTRIAEAYAPIVVERTRRLIDRWAGNEVRDFHADMMALTAQIAGQCFFGADVSQDVDAVSHEMVVLGELLTARLDSVLAVLPDGVPTPTNVKVRRSVRKLDRIVYSIIEHRRRSRASRDDLLSRLLAAVDDDGSGMSDKQLRDEVMTFFLAGHETTSLLLSWTLYLLARDRRAQARLRDDVRDALSDGLPSAGAIARLPFLDAVLCESLRLYPPVWGMSRQATADCEIAGQHVPKGTSVIFSQWVIQRDPRYFDHPDSFQAERWLDGLQKRLPRYAYFPFGGGQRICIGANFAMLEAGLILAMLLQRFEVEPIAGEEVVTWPAFTLRPRFGVHLALTRAG